MNPHPAVPPDEEDRRRIRNDLDATLFVEAGAGAGKTSSLVDRVVNLVVAGEPITGIAAITFTEKAAAELRHRIRDELTVRPERAAVAAAADLDHAPIGTLHAFARRILNEFPIEAGLPPGFGVLDELESNMRFDDEWNELLDVLLADPDPPGGIVDGGVRFVDMCTFEGFGIETGLRQVASDFRFNWDLVEVLVDRSDPPAVVVPTHHVVRAARELATTPTPADDRQAEVVAELGQYAEQLEATDDLATTLATLDAIRRRIGAARHGNKSKWKALGEAALHDLRAREVELGAEVDELLDRVRADRKRLVGAIAGRFVLDAARRRVTAGSLDFHDLLVRARQLLATHPTVRRRLHERYPRVLLDEFQDTDPIQLEIAVRLTADPDDPAQAGDWRALRPRPGRLFIVGDPKQSIYRFRRADIGQYLRAADQIGADRARLSANFRSTQAVIDFTNDVFDRAIVERHEAQPAFQPLDACRRQGLLDHGTVTVLGADPHHDLVDDSWVEAEPREHGKADELRRREATDVARVVATALAEGWPVGDDAVDGTRPCRPGDICILLPTRLSLAALEGELRGAAIPYRAENSAMVYAASEIRDLLLVLRAADDPTDELALVSSLRSPLYGCSDVELWEWKRGGGTWRLWAAPPDELRDHPVADAIAHVRSIHDRITTHSAADLLAAIADERRMFDLAITRRDARDVWRRLRFVIDQARAWADAGGRGVRRYLRWARLQAEEGRITETILPEHDHDAVRLMTVHASKGLEFPITIVSGLTTQPRRRSGTEVVWAPDTWHLTGRGDDGSFAEVAPIDELMSDAERRRLLYVACTRAVDHLVVSLHRASDDAANLERDPEKLTSAELLWRYGAAAPSSGATSRHLGGGELPGPASTDRDEPDDYPDVDAWRDALSVTLGSAARRSAIAATRLADEVRLLREQELDDDAGLDKHPVNIDLPPWQRGRYGTSIGRAVHGTLQFCDLAAGDDIDDLARSQCAAEGIIGLDRRVAALARSAITAPIVRSVVAGAEHWRELFIAAPVGDRVLEGYIDLLVRTPDGLVIVDYKTDQWSGPVQTAERVGRYRTQLAAYGAALESALDEPIAGGVLVRCRSGDDAEQIEIPDWREAIDEVRQLVA